MLAIYPKFLSMKYQILRNCKLSLDKEQKLEKIKKKALVQ